MRRRAAQLREQGDDLRTMADQLVARTEALRWEGRAADALGERIRERAAQLREVAARHDGAADSLEAHLVEVDRLKDAIARAERRTGHLVADGEELPEFTAPPPGHRDWLAVELPGL
jgi:Rad3-related DNA helicase